MLSLKMPLKERNLPEHKHVALFAPVLAGNADSVPAIWHLASYPGSA